MGMKYDFLYDEILREGIDIDKQELLINPQLIKLSKLNIVNCLSDFISDNYNYPRFNGDSISLDIKYGKNNTLLMYDYVFTKIGTITQGKPKIMSRIPKSYYNGKKVLSNSRFSGSSNSIYNVNPSINVEVAFAYNHGIEKMKNLLLEHEIRYYIYNERIYLLDTTSIGDAYRLLNDAGISKGIGLPMREFIGSDDIICLKPLDISKTPNSIGTYVIVLDSEDMNYDTIPNICYIGSQLRGMNNRLSKIKQVSINDLYKDGSSTYRFNNAYINMFLSYDSIPSASIYFLETSNGISKGIESILLERIFKDENYMNSKYLINIKKSA